MSRLRCQINCMNLSLFVFFAASDCQVNNGHNGAPKWGGLGGACRGGDLKIFKADARVRGELHSNFHWLHEETAGIKLKAVFSRPLRRHAAPLQRNYPTLFDTSDSSNTSPSRPPPVFLHHPHPHIPHHPTAALPPTP